MDNLIWKIKNFFRSLIPLVVIGGIAFGGWNLYKSGTFRNGIQPGIASLVRKVPFFGSRMSHFISSSRTSEVASSRQKGLHNISKKKHRRAKHRVRRHHR